MHSEVLVHPECIEGCCIESCQEHVYNDEDVNLTVLHAE